MAPSVHFATVTIRPPPSNSPTTHVHSPDPNPMGWDEIWIGVPPVLSTNAFMASMWSWMPWVGGCPCTSTTTSSAWWRANTPSQSALFHPVKSRWSMFLRFRVTLSMPRRYEDRRSGNSGPLALHRYNRAMPRAPAPHRVAVLALPGVLALELGTATQVFGRDSHYDLTVCDEGRAAITPSSGFAISTSAGLEALRRADTVIVPGYDDVGAHPSPAVAEALRKAHQRGA